MHGVDYPVGEPSADPYDQPPSTVSAGPNLVFGSPLLRSEMISSHFYIELVRVATIPLLTT